MEPDQCRNFLIGNIKSGKSTLINFLNSIELEISRSKITRKCQITAPQGFPLIGNSSSSTTIKSNILGTYVDQAGFQTNKNQSSEFAEKLFIYRDLKKYPYIKFLIVISYDILYGNNGEMLINSLNSIISAYGFTDAHLQSIHVILSRYK